MGGIGRCRGSWVNVRFGWRDVGGEEGVGGEHQDDHH